MRSGRGLRRARTCSTPRNARCAEASGRFERGQLENERPPVSGATEDAGVEVRAVRVAVAGHLQEVELRITKQQVWACVLSRFLTLGSTVDGKASARLKVQGWHRKRRVVEDYEWKSGGE